MSVNIGITEFLIIIAAIAVVVLMPVWVPRLVRSIRRSLRKRRKALRRYASRFKKSESRGGDEVRTTAFASKEATGAGEVQPGAKGPDGSAGLDWGPPEIMSSGETSPDTTEPKKDK